MYERRGYGVRRDGLMLRGDYEVRGVYVRGVYVRGRETKTIDDIRKMMRRWEKESGMVLFNEIDGKLYWVGSEEEFKMYVIYEKMYNQNRYEIMVVR